MNCIIVDDEPLAREGIELLINEIPFIHLEGQFEDALQANNFLLKQEIDLIFLDIEMPGINGLDLIRSLPHKPQVIITSAYPQYAVEGFDLNVVDYLVKPIRLERFLKAVNKAREKISLHNQPLSEGESYIFVKSERKYHRVYFDDIRYIKGMKDYVMIMMPQQNLMTAMNIKTILEQLPELQFARVGKSHIINVNFIESVDTNTIMLDGERIPLGKSYRDDFINCYVRNNLVDRK